MAKIKGPKTPSKTLVLDATGRLLLEDLGGTRSAAVSLHEGSPAEVREHLGFMGDLLISGVPLGQTERMWLGRALKAVAQGGCPREALRLKGKRGSAYEKRHNLLQADDLVSQGASLEEAYRFMAAASESGSEEREKKAQAIKKACQRTRPGSAPSGKGQKSRRPRQ